MKHIIVLLTLCLSGAGMAHAFNIDLNKLIDAAKNVKDLKPVDEKGEAEIGNVSASNLLGAAPLVKDEKLQSYVNHVGLWLASQTERPDLPWRFGVMDSDSVNAFAAPGGYVFITRGLLLRMHSEAELAGVLAHEISHVLKQHHLQAIQKNAQVGLVGNLMSLTNSNERGLAADAKKKMISVSSELYARGLDKDDEYEADRMGVVIAARAGYDPYGLPAMLQTLEAMNPQDSELALMFKTHPDPHKRLELLDGLMTGTMERYAGQQVVTERFQKTVGTYAHDAKP